MKIDTTCGIREAEAGDYEEIYLLWRLACDSTYHFLQVSHTEEEKRDCFFNTILIENDIWIANDDEKIFGFLAMSGEYIDRLYIHPMFHRQGIGTKLLNHAKEISPRRLRLFTHQKNDGAMAFYEKHGFTVLRFGTSPPPESEPDVEYGWERPE